MVNLSNYITEINANDITVVNNDQQGVILIMPQQIDVNKLNQAKANVTLCQTLLTQAIEKSSSDPTLAQEALKQANNEITQALAAVNTAQSEQAVQKTE
jgi:hypothetical protein